MTVSRGNYNIYEQLTSARLVSASNVSGTYYNGPTNSGVGAKLTGGAATLTVDGVLVNDGDRILLQGQTAPYQNGLYDKDTVDGVFVLTRSADFQNIEQLKAGQYLTISEGSSNSGSIWVLLTPLPEHFGIISVGTENDIVFFASGLNGGFGTAADKDASDNALATVASVDGATTVGNIAQFDDIAGTIEDGPVLAARVLTSAISTPDVSIDMVAFDVTVTAAALAAGANVPLYVSSGAKQYKVRALWANSGGTNFSGGGGDRLLAISDGTTVYSLIPAASIQTLVNAGWGISAALPFPAAAAINTSTAAGANLRAIYSGGASDYAAGSVVISGLLQRVA